MAKPPKCCLRCDEEYRDTLPKGDPRYVFQSFPQAMLVCPDCGNKRCPKATDHRLACTGSNDPGQPGSAYPAGPHWLRYQGMKAAV